MNYITIDAINDIGTFYGNTARRYPNIWDYSMVTRYITDTINAMSQTAIEKLRGERQPLVNTLNNGVRAELFICRKSKRVWYFTAEPINSSVDDINKESDILIDNAIYYANESNRAFRRGRQNPSAPLGDDDRRNQRILECKITESKLCSIISETIRRILFTA